MPEVVSILNYLGIYFPKNFSTFMSIISSLLCMSGQKTMLNISRWSEFSYKTIERFFDRDIPWLEMNLKLIMILGFLNSELLISSDETTVSKSGKKTDGLEYFFSSILQKPVKSLCFSGFSLINAEKKRSYPLFINQMIYTDEEKEMLKTKKEKRKKSKGGKVGRPKGSKNNKKKNIMAPTFRLLKEQFEQLSKSLTLKIKYFVADGKYGNNTCVRICKDFGYHLISKLQYNSALYFKFTGEYSGRGRTRIYGDKLDYKNIPGKYLVSEKQEKNSINRIYQIKSILNKSFDSELNVVIVQKITPKKVAHVLFFSTDLTLNYQKIIDYYSARFQIEFNFRDAKEFWGLEDFMNTKEERIHNAANLAFFMVNLSLFLLDKFRAINHNPASGIRDLIASYRADKYYQETLKLVLKFNPHILIPNDNLSIISIGHIHLSEKYAETQNFKEKHTLQLKPLTIW